jgi:hypothetical protein
MAAGEARVAFHSTTTARKAHIDRNGKSGNPKHWSLDSGASEHFSPHEHVMTNYKTP